MNLKISKYIKNAQIKSYANGEKVKYDIKVDCSDGENPYGCSNEVMKELKNIKLEDISKYSYDNKLKEELAKYWKINLNNIVLASGSVEALYDIGILFKNDSSALLTYVPTFPNFINYCKMIGYKIETVLLEEKENYKYNTKNLIKKINPSINLIYIDNPNNPTGQTIDKNELIKIISHAEKLGIGVIIDEAYGDYISKEESCIDLINIYNNLIIIRTFSKGLGMAGIRAGYIVSSKEICEYLNKMSHPYNISQISRKLAIKGLQDIEFVNMCKDKIKVNKQRIQKSLPKNIKMAQTNETTSICLLYSDEDIDLCEKFKKNGIKVYSGESFENLNKRSVRLNLPNDEKMEILIKSIKNMFT